jgi:hypothetical protein
MSMILPPFVGYKPTTPAPAPGGSLPLVFEITSLFDFSPIGLKDGDYGILTTNATNFMTTTERIVVQYKHECPVAAGAGGGTQSMWLPPKVYQASPEIQAYLTGQESIEQDLIDHGWSLALLGPNASFTSVTASNFTPWVRLNANFTLGSTSEVRIIAPTILGGERFYISTESLSTLAGGIGFTRTGMFHAPGSLGETKTQYAWGKNRRSGQAATFDRVWQHAWDDANSRYDQIVSQQTIRDAANVLSTSVANKWNIQALSGNDLGDLIETRVNGCIYTTYRRDVDGAGGLDEFTLCLNAVSDPVTNNGSARIDYRNFYFMTW